MLMIVTDSLLSGIPQAEKPSRQIVLIRHGQYVEKPKEDCSINNSDCSYDSQQVLTELGRKQATLTGLRIKELLEAEVLYPIDTVYYSTMVCIFLLFLTSVYYSSISLCIVHIRRELQRPVD